MTGFNNVLKEVKAAVRRKGLVYLSELDSYLSELNKKDRIRLLETLKRDKNVSVVESDMLEWMEKKPIIQNEIYLAILNSEKVEIFPGYLRAGSSLFRGLTAVGFPSYADNSFLKTVLAAKDVDVAFYLEPASIRNLEAYLNQKLGEVEDKLHEMVEVGINAGSEYDSLKLKGEELEGHLTNISKRKAGLFNFSLFFVAKGNNAEELDAVTSKVMALMRKSKVIAKPTINYQKPCVKSAAPVGLNFLRRRTVIVSADLLASSFPFVKV